MASHSRGACHSFQYVPGSTQLPAQLTDGRKAYVHGRNAHGSLQLLQLLNTQPWGMGGWKFHLSVRRISIFRYSWLLRNAKRLSGCS